MPEGVHDDLTLAVPIAAWVGKRRARQQRGWP